MGISEYLSQLDLDQLRNARDVADSLIKGIEDQERVKLWVVAGTCVNEAAFKDDEFNSAKKKLCEYIMSDEFTPDDVLHDHPRINRHACYESEIPAWMELNK